MTKTLLPSLRRREAYWASLYVFPVPGGPCIAAHLLFSKTDDKIAASDLIEGESYKGKGVKKYINFALSKYGRDTKGKAKAAKKLGIGLATLYRKS